LPYVAVLGGAKVSDKIGVLERLADKVDSLIVGGAMAYTFLSARGIAVGASRVEKDKVSLARDILRRFDVRKKKVLLPVDHIVASEFSAASGEATKSEAIPEGKMGLDIGPETIKLFSRELAEARTIFWNGPMGVFEREAYSLGTFGVARAIAENTQAISVVGGGDSAAAAHASGFAEKFSHISTGGGASLEYLEGEKLPGIETLRPPKRSETV
jgi:phosphoglycerate kinase